jgi:hypothetical protein
MVQSSQAIGNPSGHKNRARAKTGGESGNELGGRLGFELGHGHRESPLRRCSSQIWSWIIAQPTRCLDGLTLKTIERLWRDIAKFTNVEAIGISVKHYHHRGSLVLKAMPQSSPKIPTLQKVATVQLLDPPTQRSGCLNTPSIIRLGYQH